VIPLSLNIDDWIHFFPADWSCLFSPFGSCAPSLAPLPPFGSFGLLNYGSLSGSKPASFQAFFFSSFIFSSWDFNESKVSYFSFFISSIFFSVSFSSLINDSNSFILLLKSLCSLAVNAFSLAFLASDKSFDSFYKFFVLFLTSFVNSSSLPFSFSAAALASQRAASASSFLAKFCSSWSYFWAFSVSWTSFSFASFFLLASAKASLRGLSSLSFLPSFSAFFKA